MNFRASHSTHYLTSRTISDDDARIAPRYTSNIAALAHKNAHGDVNGSVKLKRRIAVSTTTRSLSNAQQLQPAAPRDVRRRLLAHRRSQAEPWSDSLTANPGQRLNSYYLLVRTPTGGVQCMERVNTCQQNKSRPRLHPNRIGPSKDNRATPRRRRTRSRGAPPPPSPLPCPLSPVLDTPSTRTQTRATWSRCCSTSSANASVSRQLSTTAVERECLRTGLGRLVSACSLHRSGLTCRLRLRGCASWCSARRFSLSCPGSCCWGAPSPAGTTAYWLRASR